MKDGNISGLRLKVMAAQADYDEASQALDALSEQLSLHPEVLHRSDGPQAMRSAANSEDAAFKKYYDALKEYSDYLLAASVKRSNRLPRGRRISCREALPQQRPVRLSWGFVAADVKNSA